MWVEYWVGYLVEKTVDPMVALSAVQTVVCWVVSMVEKTVDLMAGRMAA